MKKEKHSNVKCHKYAMLGLKKMGTIDRYIIPLSILQSVLNAFFPYVELYFSTYIINSLLESDYRQGILFVLYLIIINLLLGSMIDILDKSTSYRAKKIHQFMLKQIDQKVMELDFEELENTNLLQQITDAIYVTEHIGGYDVFILYYRQFVESIIQTIASFVIICSLCLKLPQSFQGDFLSIVLECILPFLVIVGTAVMNIITSKKASNLFRMRSLEGYKKKMNVERILNYYASDVYMNYSMGKDIRLFGMKDLILDYHENALEESVAFYQKYYADAGKNKETIMDISHALCTFTAYLIVIKKVVEKTVTIGEFSKYVGAVTLLNKSMSKIIDVNNKIILQTEFIKIFDDVLNLSNPKDTGTRKVELNTKKENIIEFHNVSYRYSGNKEDSLKNISCKIVFGTHTALVGRNGSGKTTFVKLLCRLYDPTEGYITLNGINIKEFRYKEYLELFSIVFQDFKLFAFTLQENITLTKKYDSSKIETCLKKAGIKEYVEQLPEGLHTIMFQYTGNGVNFSGGEQQKIAIARALYKDSPIVIFDEPTAALDPISEYHVYNNLRKMVEGKTSISISHRMGSCKSCEKILVFDDGKLIQKGTHEELVSKKQGRYYELYQAQKRYYIHGEDSNRTRF